MEIGISYIGGGTTKHLAIIFGYINLNFDNKKIDTRRLIPARRGENPTPEPRFAGSLPIGRAPMERVRALLPSPFTVFKWGGVWGGVGERENHSLQGRG
jgi:hypothetical protein